MLHLNYFYKNGDLCLEMNDLFMQYTNIYRQFKLAYYQQSGLNVNNIQDVIDLPTPSSSDLMNIILPKFEIIDRVLPPFVIKRDFKTWWCDCLNNDLCKWLDRVTDNYMRGFTIIQESSTVSNYYGCFMIQDEYTGRYNFFEKFLMYNCENRFWLTKIISVDQMDDLTVRASMFFANMYHTNNNIEKLQDNVEKYLNNIENIEIRVDNCNNMLKERLDDLEGLVHGSVDNINRIENLEISNDEYNRRINKLEDVVSNNSAKLNQMSSCDNINTTYIENTVNDLNERINNVEQNISGINEMNITIDKLEHTISDYEPRIIKLEDVVSNNSTKLNQMSSCDNISEIVTRVDKLEDVVSNNSTKLDQMSQNDIFDSNIKQRVDKLESTVIEYDTRIDKLENVVSDLRVSNNALIERVDNLEVIIANQQQIIEELKSKQSKKWFF